MITSDTKTKALHIIAPVSGETMALDKVPDPVFAERLTGDGLEIGRASCRERV